jgi:hypothetical protein
MRLARWLAVCPLLVLPLGAQSSVAVCPPATTLHAGDTLLVQASAAALCVARLHPAAVPVPVPVPTPPVPTPPASGLYPNQPTNAVRVAELAFTGPAWPKGMGAPTALAGTWWSYQDQLGLLTLGSDATAPQSPPSVLAIAIPAGTQPGYDDPDQSVRGFGATFAAEYSTLYELARFELPGATFENQEVGAKILGYWGVGQKSPSGTPTQLYSQMRGNGSSTAIGSAFPLDLKMQGSASAAYPENQNISTLVTAGRWHQFEMRATLNTIGQSNGVLQWWLDGVLIGSYANVVFRTAANPHGFWGIQYDVVWGGGGGAAKTRADAVVLDHLYLSGAP